MDTRSELNAHKTFRKCLGRSCTFNLRPVSRGIYVVNRNIFIKYAHIWTCFTHCLLPSLKTFVLKSLQVVVLNKIVEMEKFLKHDIKFKVGIRFIYNFLNIFVRIRNL